MSSKPRLLRITTVPISLKLLLRGQLSFFQHEGFDVLAVSADGPEVKSLRDEGISHHVVPMTRTISPFRDLVALFRLIALIRKFRPDIVHSHTPKAGLLGMMAAWICGVPVRLHTVAGLPLMERTGLVRSILILTEKITYACAMKVYPNSRGLETFIDESIKTSTPLKIIGKGSSNGIDTSLFTVTPELEKEAGDLREKYGIAKKPIVFCFVGRVVRDKGVNELLSAFDALSRTLDSKLLLAGPFEDELDPISQESRRIINGNNNVIALGYVNDIRPVLLASDLFIFPSYREGFPNVVMQACCMECPCIVSDINGCNEIIEHGETGLIVPPKNVSALQESMLRLASDPELRKKFAGQAREFVVRNFDQGFVWGEILKEYRELLNLSSAGNRL